MSKECSFCPLPWIHLATHPVGNVSLCCRSEFRDQINIAKHSNDGLAMSLGHAKIEEIVNSDRFREVRKAMLQGERHPACVGCYCTEDRGGESQRIYELDRHGFKYEDAVRVTDETGAVPVDLRYVELRLGNQCNLKCVTCNPMSSSRWVSDHNKLLAAGVDVYNNYVHEPEKFEWPKSEQFWQDLKDNSNSMRKIYINGGEPTLIDAHWRYLSELVEAKRAKDIDLVYSINLTPLPEFATQLWSEFKSVELNLSIDDLFERNEYIRFPSKWEETMAVLSQLEKCDFKLIVLQTLSLYNLYNIGDFYNFFAKEHPKVIVSYNAVQQPQFLSPFVLTKETRQIILSRVKDQLPKWQYEKLLKHIGGEMDWSDRWPQFKEYTKNLDQLRGQNFIEIFFETAKLYNLS